MAALMLEGGRLFRIVTVASGNRVQGSQSGELIWLKLEDFRWKPVFRRLVAQLARTWHLGRPRTATELGVQVNRIHFFI